MGLPIRVQRGRRARRASGVALVAVAVLAAALVLAPAASAAFVYVSNESAGTISVFSTNSDGSLSRVTCGSGDCPAGVAPNNIAISPNGQFLYVNDVTTDKVLPFRINSDGTLTAVACSGSNCATGSNPYYATVSPDGRFLYVSNSGSNDISVYAIGSDGSLSAVACATCQTGTGAEPETSPEQISITPNGKFLYVPNYGSGSSASTVSVFSVNADGTLTPVACATGCSTGEAPEGSDLTPSGKFLYVGNSNSGSVSVYAIGSDGSLSALTCSGCSTGPGSEPSSVAIGPRGDYLYTANYGGTISPFTIGSDGTLSPIACPGSDCTAGSSPYVAALNPAGTFLYTLNGSSQNVSVFAVGTSSSPTPVSCSSTDCSTGNGPNDLVVTPDQAPKAAFGAKPAHARHATKFNGSGSSAAPGQRVVRYDWKFGDGKTLANGGPTPSHTYSKPGRYRVTLTVTDDAGCSTGLIYTGAQTLCNGGPSARVTHTVKITAVGSRLTARPRTAPAGQRTCFAFHFTSGGHGLRDAKVRFAGHTAHTGKGGAATICLSLERGRYTAHASKSGYRTSAAVVRITAAPAFTG